ncbi:hypothetical protein [Rhodococcoides fascians]|uniref:hypothetical protein n=1 Tax=Rhodococcoides fascians TaxID=1828 RepID=UPI00050C027E|nr:hypothetical protein [Rhodococcus fascians]
MPIFHALLHRARTVATVGAVALFPAVVVAGATAAQPPSDCAVQAPAVTCVSGNRAVSAPAGAASFDATVGPDTTIKGVGKTEPWDTHRKAAGGPRVGKRIGMGTHTDRAPARIFGFCPTPKDEPLST